MTHRLYRDYLTVHLPNRGWISGKEVKDKRMILGCQLEENGRKLEMWKLCISRYRDGKFDPSIAYKSKRKPLKPKLFRISLSGKPVIEQELLGFTPEPIEARF